VRRPSAALLDAVKRFALKYLTAHHPHLITSPFLAPPMNKFDLDGSEL